MEGVLNKSKIDYVLYHLSFLYESDDKLINKFIFSDKHDEKVGNFIFFPLSSKELNLDEIHNVEDIPVLFPCSDEKSFYRIENKNLVFNHDLLKSAFYLLSGIQEYKSEYKDFLGRFPYEESIQKKLGIIGKPIVNYYFEIIVEGIQKFCELNNLPFIRRQPFNNTGLLLTHDIDKIDTYNFPDFIFKIKQIFGFTRTKYPFKRIFKSNLKYILNYLNPFYKKNPFWNFNFLLDLDKRFNLKSSFFFLHKDQVGDSYYTFKDKRIKKLLPELIKNGHEVGIHGTIRSSYDLEQMKSILTLLENVSPEKVKGGRQHRLMFQMPLTLRIHEAAGLKYDSTLGFASHEGFRNSYCYPFKLYDFENDCMINVWEIPLTVMDGTLFSYRKLNTEQAFENVKLLFEETNKFKGIFTLLWHNSYFDNDLYPGLTDFYINLLGYFSNQEINSYKGVEIPAIMDNYTKVTT